eukprot:scaffold81933_cov28-Tisochrysis_lutea.AAC.1
MPVRFPEYVGQPLASCGYTVLWSLNAVSPSGMVPLEARHMASVHRVCSCSSAAIASDRIAAAQTASSLVSGAPTPLTRLYTPSGRALSAGLWSKKWRVSGIDSFGCPPSGRLPGSQRSSPTRSLERSSKPSDPAIASGSSSIAASRAVHGVCEAHQSP